jgi:hypothetical protein
LVGDDGHWVRTTYRNAPAVGRQVLPAVEPVEMIYDDRAHSVRLGQAQIDRDTSAAIFPR